MSKKEFNQFKKQAIKFKVKDNHLFQQNSKNVPIHCVVNNFTERQTILEQLHNKSGYKGRESTYC